MKEMASYFHMRPSFDKFQLEPTVHKQFMIGKHDRKYRDIVLNNVEEAAYGKEGYRAVIFGDFGRGKTHEAHNIEYEVQRRKLPVECVYVKCHEFKAKEPFSSLFSMMLMGIGVDRVQQVATDYERRINKGEVQRIRDVVGSDEIAQVMGALSSPNKDIVRLALRWLGGEPRLNMSMIGTGLPDHLALSRDYASVMQGMAHMFKEVEARVLLFIVDEAERLSVVTHTDTYWSWVGCLRALTDLLGVGYIFYVGAKTRDLLPGMLTWDEVYTRIGGQNYRDLLDPGPDDLRQWIEELFQTVIRKGAPPEPHKPYMPEAAQDSKVDPGIEALVGDDTQALSAYPFTPMALQSFVDQCVTQDLANRPREVLKRIQSAARRAMRLDKPRIDDGVLADVQADSW